MKLKIFTIALITLWAGILGAQNMFGAYRIESFPRGADVIITGSNQFIGTTPTQTIPVMMDQFMTYWNGIPGRAFNIVIRKDGFTPLQQTIFVPYNRVHQVDALRNPTVFSYRLERRPNQGGNHSSGWHYPGGGHSEQNPGGGHGGHGHQQQADRQIRITSQPRGADIYVNGQYVGQSPLTIDIKRIIRPNQRIVIRAEKRGFRPAEEVITPRQDRIHLELQRRRRY